MYGNTPANCVAIRLFKLFYINCSPHRCISTANREYVLLIYLRRCVKMIRLFPTSRAAYAILRITVVHQVYAAHTKDWPKARISTGVSFHKCDKVATSCSCRLALIRSTVFHNTVLGSDRSWRSCYMANSVMEPYSSTDYSIVDEKKTRVRKPPSNNRHRCIDK